MLFILAPVEGCWVGLSPITIQSMSGLDRLKGRYPENFLLIPELEVCQEGGGVKKGVLGGHLGFLTGDMDDRFIPNVMNDVLLSQGR